MKKIIFAFFSIISFFPIIHCQTGWTWTELSPMPKRVSNNAVTEGFVNGSPYVYSFSGIDSTKNKAGINLGSYKYDVQNDVWTTIPNLPDTMGKIAAGASFVNGKIYIIGGYHVLPSGNEVSSNKVHVFNPSTDSYEVDAAPLPLAIDDHVQCVWRDSLIFVITGWSNTGNKKDVQIYDTYLNTWQAGTDLPYNNDYLAFGASGTIIGDTIIYNGGVRGGTTFASVAKTRIGIIDPNDPSQITWSLAQDNPGAAGYRMACSHHNNRAFWVGGAGTAYNYDGLAYSGGWGVEPLERILQFKNDTYLFDEGLGTPFGVMDLRGIAKVSNTQWIIAGGMESGQTVTNRTFLLEIDPIVASIKEEEVSLQLYPNPCQETLYVNAQVADASYLIYDIYGRKLAVSALIAGEGIDVSHLPQGVYIVSIYTTQKNLGAYRFEKQ